MMKMNRKIAGLVICLLPAIKQHVSRLRWIAGRRGKKGGEKA